MEFFAHAGEDRDLFFLQRGVLIADRGIDFLHFADGFTDGGVVGERTAHPAFHHVIHAGVFSGFANDLLRLALGADEQDLAAVDHGALQKVARICDLVDGFGDVDDADTVLGTVDIVFHFGVPTFRLMSKMTSRFEQIFDCERHFSVPPFFVTVLFHRIFTFSDPASHPCCYSVVHASGWFGGG